MELSKYKGVVDPIIWIGGCNQFFDVHHVNDSNQVVMATMSLEDDAQLWYQALKLDHPIITWEGLKSNSIFVSYLLNMLIFLVILLSCNKLGQ